MKLDNTQQAVLLLAYGCPETPDDIEAYYTDVRHGHPPDVAQLKELQDRYAAIGGKTPLLDITLEQRKHLEERLRTRVYLGMKHWHPYIPDTVMQISKDGIRKIVALVLAPHYSALSVGDYEDRLKNAIAEVGPTIQLTFIKQWGDNAIFIDSLCQRIEPMRELFPVSDWDSIEVIFTAHSLPAKIIDIGDPYKDELLRTSKLIATQLKLPHWRLAFQSAGRTRDTWLGPDILQELSVLAAKGAHQALDVPIGFITDNLEILYDLDVQAANTARALGITFQRIPSANTTPRFIDALEDVIKPFLPQ